jgi:hypothetical protein
MAQQRRVLGIDIAKPAFHVVGMAHCGHVCSGDASAAVYCRPLLRIYHRSALGWKCVGVPIP